MINKKSLWFLTLFTLILVLSVYYITMPSELLITNTGSYLEESNNIEPSIQESSILVALRIEALEETLKQMDELKVILNDTNSTVEDKNNAFEELKALNILRGEEEKLEKLIYNTYNIKSLIKIDANQIRVIVDSSEHSTSIANNIIRTIQQQYDTNKYVTVKFQS